MDALPKISVLLTDPESVLGRRVTKILAGQGCTVTGLGSLEDAADEGHSLPEAALPDVDVIVDMEPLAAAGSPPSRTAALVRAAEGAVRRYVLLLPAGAEDGATPFGMKSEGLETVVLRVPFVYGRDVPEALAQIRRHLDGEPAPGGGQPLQWIHADDLARAVGAAAILPGLGSVELTVANPFAVSGAALEQEIGRLNRLFTDMVRPDDQPRPDYPLLPPHLDTGPAERTLGLTPRRDFWVGLAEMVQTIRREGRPPIAGPAATPALALARGDRPAEGQVVVVTGATAGIGRATARELAKLGAEVVAVGRNEQAGEELVAQIAGDGGTAHFLAADLSLMANVRDLAARIAERYERLDVLINGAAAMFRDRQPTAEGHERMWAVNHLAPFLLSNLLARPLAASPSPRVLTVTCEAHRRAAANGALEGALDPFDAYCGTKLAGLMFSYALARRVQDQDFAVLAVHPGDVATTLPTRDEAMPADMLSRLNRHAIPVGTAARNLVCLAISPRYRTTIGKYFVNTREAPSASFSYDVEAGEQLWRESAEAVGLT